MAETMESIMQEITSGLTGNDAIDRNYLWQQAFKYKDHRFYTQIVMKVVPMIHERIPKEIKEKVARMRAKANNRSRVGSKRI